MHLHHRHHHCSCYCHRKELKLQAVSPQLLHHAALKQEGGPGSLAFRGPRVLGGPRSGRAGPDGRVPPLGGRAERTMPPCCHGDTAQAWELAFSWVTCSAHRGVPGARTGSLWARPPLEGSLDEIAPSGREEGLWPGPGDHTA